MPVELSESEWALVLEAMREFVTEGGNIGCYLDGDGMSHVTDPELREQYMRYRRSAVRLYLRLVDELSPDAVAG